MIFTNSYMRVICLTSNSCPFKQHLFRRLSLVKTELVEINTLGLHYNAVSAWLPNSFSEKMSADDRGIHNASYENRTPCVFLAKFDIS